MRQLGRIGVAQAVVGAVTLIALRLGANAATVGFVFLVTILAIAVWTDLTTALVSSLVATLCYNFFFFAPVGTFRIAEPANWVALLSFFAASVIASRLVLRARIEAEIAQTLYADREKLLMDRAHMEALRESDMLKTSLFRAISHDLATPLTAIRLQVDRLRMIVEDPAVDTIAEETARLQRRIENLLAMARVEATGVVPRPEPTPAADLFHAAREHLPLIVEARPVRVSVADQCPEVFVDPSLALEILVNLIENAHQASPPEAAIELSARSLEGGRVRLEIADRGHGLAETSDTPRRGLGLEIAQTLTAASGGEVTLQSRAGGGAVARVDLPAAHLPVAEEATV